MSNLNIIANGAILIRNGQIIEAGPVRRIENLMEAKNAIEIDSAGTVVMPAFADGDVELVVPPMVTRGDYGAAIRVASAKTVTARAGVVAAERARYGCLTVGARTACASDLRNTLKILRAQRQLQSKPLRIRSIYSYGIATPVDDLAARWLPAIRRDRLASVIELTSMEAEQEHETEVLRDVATLAAAAGFAVRVRSALPPTAQALELAVAAGAIAVVAPMDSKPQYRNALADIGCVHVIPASEGFDDAALAASRIRSAIDEGASIALASSYRPHQNGSFNMQFLLHLAVERLGMTPEEAIIATTYNAVCSLRLSHATGSIEPGKSADLVMMDVADYRDLPRRAGHHDVSMVMKAGQIVIRRSPLIPD
jgi:imidazolonepropionase